jgi:diguanylate cyclase
MREEKEVRESVAVQELLGFLQDPDIAWSEKIEKIRKLCSPGRVIFGGFKSVRLVQQTMIALLQGIHTSTQEAHTDHLTGALNRRGMEHFLKKRNGHCTKRAFLMIDLDYFKKINDQYGHQFGDIILQQVVGRIKKVLRDEDLSAMSRHGGDELMVTLIDVDEVETESVALRLYRAIVATPFFALEGSHVTELKVTVSMGIATGEIDELDKLLIERADKALYEAKDLGRNGVCMYEADGSIQKIHCSL